MRICAFILAALAASTLDWSGSAHSAQPTEQRLPHISIVSEGSGSPVVLIPGLSTPRAVWDGVAAELAKSHRVILVQVNGFAGDDPGRRSLPSAQRRRLPARQGLIDLELIRAASLSVRGERRSPADVAGCADAAASGLT